MTGPTEVVLEIPYQGVEATFIWADEGFGGLGYDVRIVAVDWLEVDPSGAIPFAVKTFISANEDMAIQVEAVHEHKNGDKSWEDQRLGRTNRTVKLTGKL